jgi:hypothetical protein
MVGSYMNAPALRQAYDRDGSVGAFISNTGLITAMTATQLRELNSEAESGPAVASSTMQLAVIFPTPLNLAAVFVAMPTTLLIAVYTSKDSTNGVDGTWTLRSATASRMRDVKPNYRIATELVSLSGSDSQDVVGVKIVSTTANQPFATVRALHVYGDPSNLATEDRLQIWHPTVDEPLSATALDWGDVPRSSSADKSFRIKNLSTTLTAEDIDLYVESLNPGTPSVAGMHTLSANGGATFLNAQSIVSLAPGAISPVFILRRVVPSNAQVSTWSARVGADVGTWT